MFVPTMGEEVITLEELLKRVKSQKSLSSNSKQDEIVRKENFHKFSTRSARKPSLISWKVPSIARVKNECPNLNLKAAGVLNMTLETNNENNFNEENTDFDITNENIQRDTILQEETMNIEYGLSNDGSDSDSDSNEHVSDVSELSFCNLDEADNDLDCLSNAELYDDEDDDDGGESDNDDEQAEIENETENKNNGGNNLNDIEQAEYLDEGEDDDDGGSGDGEGNEDCSSDGSSIKRMNFGLAKMSIVVNPMKGAENCYSTSSEDERTDIIKGGFIPSFTNSKYSRASSGISFDGCSNFSYDIAECIIEDIEDDFVNLEV